MRGALFGLASVAAASSALAAPAPEYGGDLVAYVFGAPASLDVRATSRSADRTVQAAVFEPLYERRGEVLLPVLASGPPELVGSALFVPLKRQVPLHDGRLLTPTLARAALLALEGTAGTHVLAPLARTDAGQPAIETNEARHGLRFTLRVPYPEYPRLLASPHARLAVSAPSEGRDVGTGPFELEGISARGAVRLRPFLRHRDGRPFLDAFEVRVHASRASVVAWARRKAPSLLFEVPDARDGGDAQGWPNQAPRTLVLLRTSDPALAPALDAALGRARLTRRFMEGDARPTRRLLDGLPAPEPPASEAAPAPSKLALLVSSTDRAGWQFAKRVQLDLLRGGVSATLERTSPETARARLAAPGSDIVLGTLLADAPSHDVVDQLHTLLAIAASLGAASAITEQELAEFLTATAEDRPAYLEALEAKVRARAGVVPIASRPPRLVQRSPARGLFVDETGALHAESAQMPRAAR